MNEENWNEQGAKRGWEGIDRGTSGNGENIHTGGRENIRFLSSLSTL